MSARDYEVVRFVGRLYQVSSTHIASTVLADVSGTVVDRTLTRLVKGDFIRRVGRRAPSDRGGNSAYVYQLGGTGWKLLGGGKRYRPYTAVNDHALKVADVYAELIAEERAGSIKILRIDVERPIGDARPDLSVELGLVGVGKKVSYYIEVDLGSERERIIRAKCDAYIAAYHHSTTPTFPYVVFLVPAEWRKAEVGRVLDGLGESGALFQCHLSSDYMEHLLRAPENA